MKETETRTPDELELENMIMREYSRDSHTYVRLLKVLAICLCIIICVGIIAFSAALVVINTNHQKTTTEIAKHATDMMVEMMTQYDWETDYEILSVDNDHYSGNIHVEK